MTALTRIAPCLWYDGAAREAADFYVSLFPESSVDAVLPGQDGKPLFVSFTLAGQRMQALNGGPGFPHSNAMSLSVACDTQAEIDRLWTALGADGGKELECGWVTDRWGVPWQIVPSFLEARISTGTPEQVGRMMVAVWSMKKLDLAAMQAAFDGEGS
ncbi:VOC family protein [Sandaracinobacteroides saxicola]|uniref:VOC family protein n=1 Tax=Sandaracinobacteroides saxicola TaxID=2759707 RepID=A0A7G5IG43_9SPHN|nr:VOC family protein [Sandaracinobacteroides saxicola]QMW22335.1 VOC family protein [Sandaracinobacteroides saxicola]